jgi:phage baseplate assembly protein V
MTLAVILRQLRTAIRRGILRVVDGDHFAQVEGFEGEHTDAVEIWQQYGLASRPPVGSEALYVKPGLTGETAIVVATQHRGSRPALEPGEAALYSQHGAEVRCDADGDVEITAAFGRSTNIGGATDAVIRGNAYNTALQTYLTAASAAFSAIAAEPTLSASASLTGAAATAATAFSAAASSWLSTKAKVG